MQEVGPITLVAFRVMFGLLFGIIVILAQRAKLPRTFKEWSPLLLLGIVNVAIPFFLISWGEQAIELCGGSHPGCHGAVVHHRHCARGAA